jgi:uncharacterized surface protein with fasciclin (FAS1) repeats
MMKPLMMALAVSISLTGAALAADEMPMEAPASTTTEMTPAATPHADMMKNDMAEKKADMKAEKADKKMMMQADKKDGGCTRMNTSDAKAGKLDIVDTAMMNGQFNTLAKALEAAGLTETLKGKGPFTVFAPTDAAFAALPKGTLEDLLKPENREKLQQVLTYHVVPGKVMAKQVLTLKEAKTVEGESLKVMQDNGGVMVNNANVVKTDIKTKNGVIHVIDRVLIPGS